MRSLHLARIPICASMMVLAALVVHPLRAAEPQALSGKVTANTFVYADDNHVDVVTPAVSGTIENTLAGWSVSGHYLVDVVTAASPDIVATASAPFRELRHAGALGATYKTPIDLTLAPNFAFSVEPDYLSLSGSLRLSFDILDKRLTLFGGYAYRNDTAGRTGTAFDVFQRKFQTHELSGGASLILDRSTLATLQMDGIVERGNQAKPYRYIPLFATGSTQLLPAGATVDKVNALRLDARVLEELPLERDRFALTGRLAKRFDRSTLRLEERLYIDSWGLIASTTDARYMLDAKPRFVVWPHARIHMQTGVDFWHRVYEVNPPEIGVVDVPIIRTGDRELGPLFSCTLGGGMGFEISSRLTLSLQADGMYTAFLDALYVTQRWGVFSTVSAQASFD